MSAYDLIKNTNIITIKQGKPNTGTVTLTQTTGGAVVNLTGATATGQVRALDGTLVATMTCTIPLPLTGVINYSISQAEADALTAYANIQHVWGIQPVISGVEIEEIHGGAMVVPQVVI